MKARTATRLAWSLGAVCGAATIGGIVLADLNGHLHLGEAAIAVALLSYPVVGALVAARQPHNLVGWVLCAAGLCSTLGLASDAYADYALVTAPGSLPGGVWVAWTPWLDRLISLGALLLVPSIAGAVARTIEAYSIRLGDQVDLDTLSAELLAVAGQTMQPTTATLWLRPRP